MIDLRNCKKGDKLKTRHGNILTYVGEAREDDCYDHIVEYSDGFCGTRTHDGHVFREIRMTIDEDVVEILESKGERA